MNKIKSYIGFAIKSGNVEFGLDKCLNNKKLQVIICSSYLSNNSKSKLKQNCKNFYELFPNQLEYLNVSSKVIGISEPHLANQIISEIKHLEEENFDTK